MSWLLLLVFFLPMTSSVPVESQCLEGEGTGLLQHQKVAGGSTEAQQKRRHESKGRCGERIRPALISTNDGPEPYLIYQPDANAANTEVVTEIYEREQGFTSVRPDEAGLAFDLRCMFPVKSLDDLPDPNNESNWRWNASDSFFHAIKQGGFAPFLKLGVNTWTSTRISGQAFVNWTTGNVTSVIPPKAYDVCEPWPALSPVMNAIGAAMA